MAEDAENPFEEQPAGDRPKASLVKTGIRVGLMAAVLGVGSAGGYTLAGLLGGAKPADPNQPAASAAPAESVPLPTPAPGDDQEFEYFDFDPITVNLNDRRLARYIRATVTLAFRKADAHEALKQVQKKQKELLNWMNLYLADKTLEDVRGLKNLNQIRREMQDAFNNQLWPRSRPLIDQVLFKQFNIQ
ncbi:MAG TPA: flagellar basal body-associated FliL family protein [Phycisphaerae bacterium]|nr:flagellar basal body-associated FliL family protein [Phycisphaerae bacterium]